jgi:hypothetical protein
MNVPRSCAIIRSTLRGEEILFLDQDGAEGTISASSFLDLEYHPYLLEVQLPFVESVVSSRAIPIYIVYCNKTLFE